VHLQKQDETLQSEI